jgi:hypothetical protein
MHLHDDGHMYVLVFVVADGDTEQSPREDLVASYYRGGPPTGGAAHPHLPRPRCFLVLSRSAPLVLLAFAVWIKRTANARF